MISGAGGTKEKPVCRSFTSAVLDGGQDVERGDSRDGCGRALNAAEPRVVVGHGRAQQRKVDGISDDPHPKPGGRIGAG